MAINAKLGVDIGSFKSGIQEGQNILKGLNAEMKATEAEFKATGNAEKALEQKTKTLNSQLQVQKGIADKAKAALEAMDKAGIEPTDKAYQQMYATMMNATAGMNEAQAALNGLGASASSAAGQADQLTQSVQGIGKKISLDQVLSGINAITTGLETAAKKAVDLGKDIWNAAMDAARLSDDILTQANMLDMTPEKYQQYKGVFATIGEITIAEWAAAKRKIQKAINDPSKDQVDILAALGISTHDMVAGKTGIVEGAAKDWETVFWEAAKALKTKVESGEISQDLADTYGEAIFGKKFSSLKTLIDMGRDTFNEALENQNTASDEALEKDAALNDAVIKLQDSFDKLKIEVMSGLAPELTKVADAIDKVLGSILEYLQTPKGQAMLQSLGDTISSLFEDLTNVDPNSVLETLTSAFDSIKKGLEWIKTNKESLITALEAIGVAFGALKLSEMAINVWKFVDGARTLMGLGGKDKTPTTTTTTTPGTTDPDKTTKTEGSSEKTPLLDKAVQGMATKAVLDETFRLLDRSNKAAEGTSTAREWTLNLHKIDYEEGKISKEQYDEMVKETNELYDKLDVLVNVQPEVEDDAAKKIADDVGPVEIPVEFTYANPLSSVFAGVLGGVNFGLQRIGHANGLPFVPYDGYLAMLHRGERVLTARANRSYTYNSNNYFGNVNLNNGQDIDALCTSIDRHNRRMQSGFGA